jgi:hypothetical protein
MPTFVKIILCLIVGAGGATPAYRHTHVGGDSAHTHKVDRSHHASEPVGDGHCHHHGHGHSHAHHHAHSHHLKTHPADEDDPRNSGASQINHVHICWFGIEFTVPEPASAPGESQEPEISLLVMPISSPILIGSDSGRTAAWGAMHSAVMPNALCASRCLTNRFSVKTCLANPLCDTARHERSGVQLA